jgi:hypothetical protein
MHTDSCALLLARAPALLPSSTVSPCQRRRCAAALCNASSRIAPPLLLPSCLCEAASTPEMHVGYPLVFSCKNALLFRVSCVSVFHASLVLYYKVGLLRMLGRAGRVSFAYFLFCLLPLGLTSTVTSAAAAVTESASYMCIL